jgi:two-component system, NtrC family, nitrogen regulation response regulator GlnG
MTGMAEREPTTKAGRWAEMVAQAVPAIVGELRTGGSIRIYRETMALMERPLLVHVLTLTGGNQLRAARLLGVNRNTLRKRCRDLGLATTAPGRGAIAAPPR